MPDFTTYNSILFIPVGEVTASNTINRLWPNMACCAAAVQLPSLAGPRCATLCHSIKHFVLAADRLTVHDVRDALHSDLQKRHPVCEVYAGAAVAATSFVKVHSLTISGMCQALHPGG